MDGAEMAAWDRGPGLFESVWRFRWVVVLVTVIAAGLSYANAAGKTPRYEASARMVLTDPRQANIFRGTPGSYVDIERYMAAQASLVSSREVAGEAAQSLGPPWTADKVRSQIRATASSGINAITILGVDATARGASALANAVAEAYKHQQTTNARQDANAAVNELERSAAQIRARLETLKGRATLTEVGVLAQRDALVQQLTTVENQADQVRVAAALYNSGVDRTDPATPPGAPTAPQPRRSGVIGGLLGFLAATMLVFWLGERRRSVRRPQDAEAALAAPFLATVPDIEASVSSSDVPGVAARTSATAQAFQLLSAAIAARLADVEVPTILVAGAQERDGASLAALNVAAAMARTGRRVALIDGTTEHRLTELLHLERHAGLANAAWSDLPVSKCTQHLQIGAGAEASIQFVPAGPAREEYPDFFQSAAYDDVLDQLRADVDVIVIDAPPLLTGADSIGAADRADGVLLVIRRGTPLPLLEETRHRLDLVAAAILGYAFNPGSRARLRKARTPAPATSDQREPAVTRHRSRSRGETLLVGRRTVATQAARSRRDVS